MFFGFEQLMTKGKMYTLNANVEDPEDGSVWFEDDTGELCYPSIRDMIMHFRFVDKEGRETFEF